MGKLKPHQEELLRFIIEQNSPVSAASLDRRNLRPLKAQHLVVEIRDSVYATEAGRAWVGSQKDSADRNIGVRVRLSEQQEEVLRYLIRQTGPVPEDHLDGRVVRALHTHGLVTRLAGWVRPSEDAPARLYAHEAHRRTSRQHEARDGSSARIGAIYRAVEQLEAALPRDAEIVVGATPAYADDILKAVRQFAQQRETKRRPRSGTRA